MSCALRTSNHPLDVAGSCGQVVTFLAEALAAHSVDHTGLELSEDAVTGLCLILEDVSAALAGVKNGQP